MRTELKNCAGSHEIDELIVYSHSQYIEEAVEAGDDGSAVAHLALLVDAWLKLKSSQCTRLMTFLKQTILYWHNLLREKFEK